MQEENIDISRNKPKLITAEILKRANKVISMGCGAEVNAACPASYIETEDWALEDPYNKSIEVVRRIRDDVKARIINLIEREC